MDTNTYLGLDQGSGSTKAVLLSDKGETLFETAVEAPERIVKGREVEQSAEGILNTVVEVVLKAKQWAHQNGIAITAAGLACQRSGVLAWNSRDGIPQHDVITWADTRTIPVIQNFGKGTERISVKTGIPTLPNFAGGKIALLQREFLDNSITVGTLDSFLLYRLSGRRTLATEDTMAARTMLYSLESRNWDAQLCQEFKVDQRRLPPIVPSLAAHTVFEEVSILALLGDQQAALIGSQITEAQPFNNRPLLNLGTIASLMVDTGSSPIVTPGVMTSVGLSFHQPKSSIREYTFISEITSAVTGEVLMEPTRRGWCSSLDDLEALCRASIEASPAARSIAYLVNHRPTPPLKAERTPNVFVSKPDATVADKARAIVENVGNLVIRMFEEMRDKGVFRELEGLHVNVAGGGSKLSYLLQYIADCTGVTFHPIGEREATARGAAVAAQRSHSGKYKNGTSECQENSTPVTCVDRERKKRYLMWQRLEGDLLRDTLPSHAEIEE
jgi:glycerol kinase